MLLVKTGLLQEYLLANNTLQFMTGGSKCQWSKNERKLKFIRKAHTLCIVLGILFGQGELINFVFHRVLGTEPVISFDKKYKTVAIIFACGKVIAYFASLAFLKHYDTQESFFNNIIQLEELHWKSDCDALRTEKHKVRVAKYACMALRILGIRQLGVTLPIVATLIPSLPVNIFGYPPGSLILKLFRYALPCIPNWNWYFEKLFVFFGNWLMWEIHIKLIIIAAIEKIIGSVCLTLSVLQFQRKLECNTAGSGQKTVRFYRSIQILTEMFNEVESMQLVVVFATFGCAQVAAGLNVLGGKGEEHKAASSFLEALIEYWIQGFHFVIIGNTIVVVNFLYGHCAQVHDTSKAVLDKLRRSTHDISIGVTKRVAKSLAIVRVKFGTTNYVEKITPVVFQLFLVERIVDGLLLKRRFDK